MTKADAIKLMKSHFIVKGTIVASIKNPHVAIGGTNLANLFCEGWVEVFGDSAQLTAKGRSALESFLQPA